MIKAQLIDLGRGKVNKTVQVKTVKQLHKEIGKHLMSKGWGMIDTDMTPIDGVYEIEAGFRSVGKVKIIEDTTNNLKD
jgi:hypothetical protein